MAVHAPTIRRLTVIGLTLLATGALGACGNNDGNGTTATSGAGVTSRTGPAGGALTTTRTATTGGALTTTRTTTTGGTVTTPRTTTTGGVAGATATRLSITADELSPDRLAWSRSTLASRSGEVTIALDNPSGNELPHGVEVEGNGVEKKSQVITPGSTTSVSAKLAPGRYTFYCPVANHRQLGMEGTLTVR